MTDGQGQPAEAPRLPVKDEIEWFKPFVEIAKYIITILLAFAAVGAGVMKLSGAPVPPIARWAFYLCLFGNILVFLIAHRVVSEASSYMTTACTPSDRASGLERLRSHAYSALVTLFLVMMIAWTIALLLATL